VGLREERDRRERQDTCDGQRQDLTREEKGRRYGLDNAAERERERDKERLLMREREREREAKAFTCSARIPAAGATNITSEDTGLLMPNGRSCHAIFTKRERRGCKGLVSFLVPVDEVDEPACGLCCILY